MLLTGQGVHSLRRQLAEAVFNMPPERITVRAPDVGGRFGVKNFPYPEWVLVLWAGAAAGPSRQMDCRRGEEFISFAQGRDNHTRARLALDRDCRFLALDVDSVANLTHDRSSRKSSVLFYKQFNGDDGAGIHASWQTGETGVDENLRQARY